MTVIGRSIRSGQWSRRLAHLVLRPHEISSFASALESLGSCALLAQICSMGRIDVAEKKILKQAVNKGESGLKHAPESLGHDQSKEIQLLSSSIFFQNHFWAYCLHNCCVTCVRD